MESQKILSVAEKELKIKCNANAKMKNATHKGRGIIFLHTVSRTEYVY